VIIDEEVNPPEVLLVQHSYRTKGAWGLPGGSLESGLRNPWEPSTEEPRDDFWDPGQLDGGRAALADTGKGRLAF
jgi:8-oxo-dGTP pyrophosphatase MutT (NUDIX family)